MTSKVECPSCRPSIAASMASNMGRARLGEPLEVAGTGQAPLID